MSATQIAGSITDPTQIATIQSLGNDIAGVVTPSVAPNTFVFWAGFDGTNNIASDPSYSGDVQSTAVGALWTQIDGAQKTSLNPSIGVGYYAGVGTLGTLPGSTLFPTEQAVITATQAYNDFAEQAATWLQTHPGGSVTTMLASFSRGSIAAAVFSQMLYEDGLVYKGTMLVPPGQVGVSAGLIISPVNTGGVGDVPFAPNAQNMVEIVAANEYRVAYEQDIYGGFKKVVSWPGNHGDVGGFYPGGLGAIYLQDYTDYFNAVNPGMAGAVLPDRQYSGGAVDIHVESFSLGNPQNLSGGSYAAGSRIGTSNITPLGSSVVTGTGDTYTYVNYKGETIVMERVGGVIQSLTRTPPSQVGGPSVVDYQISSPTSTLATANPDGSATVVAKNAAGTILQSTITFANGDIEQVSYTNGTPSSVVRSSTIANDVTKVVSLYDATGTVLRTTVTSHVADNGAGVVTTSQVIQDGTGALIRVVESVQDANAKTNTTTSFNISNGTVDGKTITIYNSASGEITRNKLDTNDVLLSSTIQLPGGEVDTTSYQGGNPVSVTKRLTDAATGGATEYVFDGSGNALQSVTLFDRNNTAGMTLTISADGGFVYSDQQAAELGSSGAFINQLASGMAAAEIAGVFTPADYNGVIHTSVTAGSSGNLIADITFQSVWDSGKRTGSITTAQV